MTRKSANSGTQDQKQPSIIAGRRPDLKDRLEALSAQDARDQQNLFPARLKQLRSELSIRQSEMAQILGVPLTTYSNWEQGRSFPSVERLPRIAAFFDVTVDYLLGTNPDTVNRRIIEQLSALSDEKRQAVEVVLRSMAQK